MRRRLIACGMMALSLAGSARAEELALQGAAAASPTTLWNFLGIPQGVNKIKDATSNKFGDRPQAERKPPLKRIADPENLQSDNPAIKKAAQVKQAEDQAPQKVKALKYLARMGCGCYDLDGEITKAFLAALEDCTEEVRFQAAIAILDSAKNNCEMCSGKRCCSEELSAKLAKIAYEKNDKCCWYEPSERVRMAAADALKCCCACSNNVPPGLEPVITPEGEQVPVETVPPGTPPAETVPNSASIKREVSTLTAIIHETSTPAGMPAVKGPQVVVESERVIPAPAAPRAKTSLASSRREAGVRRVEVPAQAPVPTPVPEPREARPLPAPPHVHGAIERINTDTGTAQVRFSGSHGLQAGHRLNVMHRYLLGDSSLGEMEVVAVGPSAVTVRPVGNFNFGKLALGDEVTTGKVKRSLRLTPSRRPIVEEPAAEEEAPMSEGIARLSEGLMMPREEEPRPAPAHVASIPRPAAKPSTAGRDVAPADASMVTISDIAPRAEMQPRVTTTTAVDLQAVRKAASVPPVPARKAADGVERSSRRRVDTEVSEAAAVVDRPGQEKAKPAAEKQGNPGMFRLMSGWTR